MLPFHPSETYAKMVFTISIIITQATTITIIYILIARTLIKYTPGSLLQYSEPLIVV